MDYTLEKPVTFKGRTYTTVTLSDYFKTRHKLVLAENVGKNEALQHQYLVMAFCENLPRESFGDIYADDIDFIADHVNRVMLEYAESHGMTPEADSGKKKRAPSKVIRPVR